MYPCSDDFHAAVRNGNKQTALLIFDDAVFTDEDISVESGISFSEYFCTDDDLTIGSTPSSEISFTLFNEGKILADYPFGKFIATLGVQIGETYTVWNDGVVSYMYGQDTISISHSSPYVYINGVATSFQPAFRVLSSIAYDGKIFLFGNDDAAYITLDETQHGAVSLNAFMADKVARWNVNGGMFAGFKSNILSVSRVNMNGTGTPIDGYAETYEFVPFGTFIAERPKVSTTIAIEITANDQMQLFDDDIPEGLFTYNSTNTIKRMLDDMCAHLGVQCITDTFINQNTTISKAPDNISNCTMRNVLGWIAEAACSVVRFNRDGKLVFTWLNDTGLELDETDYEDFKPFYFETPTVDKIVLRDTSKGDTTIGTGENAYLIQNNPLLKGAETNG